jgi:uncharacterized protein
MSFRVETDLMVPMRDGETLATDVWIPGTGPGPALLIRIPYGKNERIGAIDHPLIPNIHTLLQAGYAVVWQDCRGTYRSSGSFTPMVNEPEDGVDTIAWIAGQPWCDGSVGMLGLSYLGIVQWAAASQTPPALKAIAPAVTSGDTYRAPWYSEGGAMSWHLVWSWATEMALVDAQRALAAGSGDIDTVTTLAAHLVDPEPHLQSTAAEQDALSAYWPWWSSQWLAHAPCDRSWQELSVDDAAPSVTVPALNIGGWFDLFAGATVRSYVAMKSQARTPEARDGQRLIIGPWDHMTLDGVYPDRQFGLGANVLAVDLTDDHVRFFDRWLRGRADALDGSAPVRIFVMGIDQWRDEPDWPLPDTRYVDYHLDSGGGANTADGDGVLSTTPATAEATDTYAYNPARPVPSIGGRVLLAAADRGTGPADQRPVESREDVLCFSTSALENPVEVTGNVSLVLHVTSSACDTDFTGKLVDVFPDGRAIYLTDGILRMRYRRSLAEPELLEPGQVYEVMLDLSVTSNVFLPGHRIRLEVSSSNFPRYDRNTNTGGSINEETLEQAVVAINRVLHGPAHPSRLILPLIERR